MPPLLDEVDELDDEVLELLELDELDDEPLLDELDEELDELLDELLLELDDELDEDELDEEELDEEEDEDEPPPLGTEHSLTPPAMRPPKVASLQVKLPTMVLKKNLSARPKATLVEAATEQVLPSVQRVT